MRTQVQSLASLSELRISIAVAVVLVSSHSSDLTPSLGTSICYGCSPKKTKGERKVVQMDCFMLRVFYNNFFFFFMAAPTAYESSWARNLSRIWGNTRSASVVFLTHPLPGSRDHHNF